METKKKGIIEYQKYEPINDIFVVKYKKPMEKYSKGYMFEPNIGDLMIKKRFLQYIRK